MIVLFPGCATNQKRRTFTNSLTLKKNWTCGKVPFQNHSVWRSWPSAMVGRAWNRFAVAISSALRFYKWKKELSVEQGEAKRKVAELERENTRLKKM